MKNKNKNWFEQNNWIWDKRDHIWKRVYGEKEGGDLVKSAASRAHNPDSKPFTKVNNILIVDNVQYPFKFHEVMYKK